MPAWGLLPNVVHPRVTGAARSGRAEVAAETPSRGHVPVIPPGRTGAGVQSWSCGGGWRGTCFGHKYAALTGVWWEGDGNSQSRSSPSAGHTVRAGAAQGGARAPLLLLPARPAPNTGQQGSQSGFNGIFRVSPGPAPPHPTADLGPWGSRGSTTLTRCCSATGRPVAVGLPDPSEEVEDGHRLLQDTQGQC